MRQGELSTSYAPKDGSFCVIFNDINSSNCTLSEALQWSNCDGSSNCPIINFEDDSNSINLISIKKIIK